MSDWGGSRVYVCGGGGAGGNSLYGVDTDVRPEWPPFQAWKYIYRYTFSP